MIKYHFKFKNSNYETAYFSHVAFSSFNQCLLLLRTKRKVNGQWSMVNASRIQLSTSIWTIT